MLQGVLPRDVSIEGPATARCRPRLWNRRPLRHRPPSRPWRSGRRFLISGRGRSLAGPSVLQRGGEHARFALLAPVVVLQLHESRLRSCRCWDVQGGWGSLCHEHDAGCRQLVRPQWHHHVLAADDAAAAVEAAGCRAAATRGPASPPLFSCGAPSSRSLKSSAMRVDAGNGVGGGRGREHTL